MIENKLPIYNVALTDDTFLTAISLVDYPAVESNFQYFSKENKYTFKIENEEKKRLLGVVLRADFPIYRNDNGYEYYITFSKDSIRYLAEKYLKDGWQNRFTLMHNDSTDGLEMVQYFIKDSDKGINPNGFNDIADGSLFAEFQITDNTIWEGVKNGTFKGFSVESFLNLVKVENKAFKKDKHQMSKLNKIKKMIMSALQEFGSVSTDKALIGYDADELEVGVYVYQINEDGSESNLEDGTYENDTLIIEVKDNKVEAINEKEVVEDTPIVEEEPKVEEEPMSDEEVVEVVEEPKEDEKDLKIKELEDLIAEKDEKIKELENKVKELENKESTPSVTEDFKTVNKIAKTGNKGLDRLSRIVNA